MKIWIKRTTALSLAVLLAGTTVATAFASAPVEKKETVYVNLNEDGSVRQQIVTDWLHSPNGAAAVADESDLADLRVIKGGKREQNAEGKLIWQLEGSDLYYRGSTDRTLPVAVTIDYFLDGKKQDPKAIVGKSGALEIHVSFENVSKNTVDINGKKVTLATPVMAAAAVVLPMAHFSEVSVTKGGTVANDAKNYTVALVSSPGLYDSLNLKNLSIDALQDIDLPEGFVISATTEAFEMEPVMITLLPKALDAEIDSSEIDRMQQNILDVQDMQNRFEAVDDDRQLRSLILDAEKTDAARQLMDDIDVLNGLDKDLIDLLPQYITTKNIKALDRIIDRTGDFDLRYLKDFDYDKDNNTKIAKGVEAALKLAEGTNLNAAQKMAQDLETVAPQLAPLKPLLTPEGMAVSQKAALLLGAVTPAAAGKSAAESKAAVQQSADLTALFKQSGLAGLSEDELFLFVQAGVDAVNAEREQNAPDPNEAVLFSTEKPKADADTASSQAPAPAAEAPVSNTPQNNTPAEENKAADENTAEAEGNGTQEMPNQPQAAQEKQIDAAALQQLAQADETSAPSQALTEGDLADALSPSDAPKVAQTPKKQMAAPKQKELSRSAIISMLSAANQQLAAPQAASLEQSVAEFQQAFSQSPAEVQRAIKTAAMMLADPQQTAPMVGMVKADIAANRQNLALSKQVLLHLDDPYLRQVVYDAPLLYDDFVTLYPTIYKMKKDIKQENLRESFRQSPQTVATLVKLKKDIEKNTDITDTLKKAVAPENSAVFADIVTTLDRFTAEATVPEYVAQVNDLKELIARKDALVALSEQNTIHTQAAEGMTTEYKVIMKTDAIKPLEADENESEQQNTQQNEGVLTRLWHKFFGKAEPIEAGISN